MVDWDLPRPATSLLLLLETGRENGLSEQECLRGTGLDLPGLTAPGVEVTARTERVVIENIVTGTGREDLGLEAGRRFRLTSFGFWGFALLSSRTLREAIDVGLRYVDLTYGLSQVVPRVRDGEVQLVFSAPDVPARITRFAVERDIAVTAMLHRELFSGQVPLRRLSLAFPPPATTANYSAALGVAPQFDAPETVMAVDDALLDLPMPRADAHTQALARAQCSELLERSRARTGLAGRVRELILADVAQPPSADEIARVLAVSPRTLRERLAAEGTSYRRLLDEVRERLAEEMLLAGLSAQQVSRRLGYVEASGFTHAFRRWKGTGPRAWRSASVHYSAIPAGLPASSAGKASRPTRTRTTAETSAAASSPAPQ